MNAFVPEYQIANLVQGIMLQGIDGAGLVATSDELAASYRRAGYATLDDAVDAMIGWETGKSAGVGFVTGLGGLSTLPVTLPAGLYATWVVQARLAAAVARLYGHSTDDERVRTYILLCLIGDSAKEVLKDVGIQVAKKGLEATLRRVPGKLLLAINRAVGFRLLTKAGTKGVINLTKVVPIAGGVVGAIVDGTSTSAVGHMAKNIFQTPPVEELVAA